MFKLKRHHDILIYKYKYVYMYAQAYIMLRLILLMYLHIENDIFFLEVDKSLKTVPHTIVSTKSTIITKLLEKL